MYNTHFNLKHTVSSVVRNAYLLISKTHPDGDKLYNAELLVDLSEEF